MFYFIAYNMHDLQKIYWVSFGSRVRGNVITIKLTNKLFYPFFQILTGNINPFILLDFEAFFRLVTFEKTLILIVCHLAPLFLEGKSYLSLS